ncbi:MAG TPA: serine hydrolase domain-containing protein [Gemmatimonas sp.]|nr:serine hydrolase domain-containing protein [Gemmatimonas sp.]
MRHPARLLSLVALCVAPALPLAAQNSPSARVRNAIQAIESMIETTGDAPLQAFAEKSLAPSYRNSFRGDSLLRHLRALRTGVGDVGGVMVRRDSANFYLEIDGQRHSTVRFALDEPGLITALELLRPGSSPAAPSVAPSPWTGVTWETLPDAVQRAAAAGFHGTIIAKRNGTEVLRTAVGMSDPVAGRRSALNSVYSIGSQPMDFTRTAVLLLAQRGKLSMNDSIGRFFRNVPSDKRGITVAHLLEGRSGLIDFYHEDGTDWDSDLSWIPKDEAVRRMLASTLRFAPGTSRASSHAAYNMLAAVIEKASGVAYPEFLRRELLTPLGMTRTGFYGETLGLSLGEFAVGGGPNVVGLPNVGPNWGPTSWLVMGSGGMVSTVEDMDKYYTALARGTLLTGAWAKQQQGRTAGAGGSSRGYFIFHVSDGAGSSVLVLTNTAGRERNTPALTGALERLVLGARP